ncbi:MAG: hypothetical protein V1262_13905, partial [Alphaproteobacteria bacterium]|nr:hypothetical protein [Alphaproteobacteria bacterium]
DHAVHDLPGHDVALIRHRYWRVALGDDKALASGYMNGAAGPKDLPPYFIYCFIHRFIDCGDRRGEAKAGVRDGDYQSNC